MSARALTIARKDLTDLARSKLLWGAALVMLALTVPQTYDEATSSWDVLVDGTQDQLLIPFVLFAGPVAIVAAYASVAGERESGSLRVLLSFPTDRGAVLLGKALSRTLLLLAVSLGTYLVLGGVLIQAYGTLDGAEYLLDAGLLAAFTFAWAGLSVGVSAAVATKVRAVAVLFGLYLALGPLALWKATVVRLVGALVEGPGFDPSELRGLTNAGSETPEWYLYVGRLNPVQATLAANDWTSHSLTPSAWSTGHGSLTHNAFGVAAVVAWGVVPLAIGYWRFGRADLG
ncbi:ABC transporter permease [Halosimplex salinum]|uniref:ABC transporter permease n=1 Tax=Halosimplex salinum TaxID=1710538 RepID=UPI000F4A0AD2|nr:ABC transporter permease subunit [Halosimplex salinum]